MFYLVDGMPHGGTSREGTGESWMLKKFESLGSEKAGRCYGDVGVQKGLVGNEGSCI